MKAAWIKKIYNKGSKELTYFLVFSVMNEGKPTYVDIAISLHGYQNVKNNLQREDETKQCGHHEDEDYNVEFLDF